MQENTKVVNDTFYIGKHKAVDLAKKYGTPLYVMDEAMIRKNMRAYKNAMDRFGKGGRIAFASKSFSCEAIYTIAKSENLYADAVSGGEIFTALKAGFDCSKLYFHGNNKTLQEIEFAFEQGVGTFVADNLRELQLIDSFAKKKGVVQDVLLRINPGVEAHTHKFIQTSKSDSKFGFPIVGGFAEHAAMKADSLENVNLRGLHAHIGSQIFDLDCYMLAVDVLTDFAAQLKTKNIVVSEINIGGGVGIRYTSEDPIVTCDTYAEFVKKVCEAMDNCCRKKGLAFPIVTLEPGRSIVANAGVTLYTCGEIKDLGTKKYLPIDGGMFDNPRYALYQVKYEGINASKPEKSIRNGMIVTLAGKCCESGDMISEDVQVASDTLPGDIIAVMGTGAYNYSMASNYNRNCVPPIVLLNDDKDGYIVKPQTYEDLIRNDAIPEWLNK